MADQINSDMEEEIVDDCVEAWERQPDETGKAYEAFAIYRDMGVSRSAAKVGKRLGKSKMLMDRWSSRHKWVERAAAWDAENERVAMEAHFNAIKDMRARHANLGGLMVDVAMSAMQELATKPHRISGTAATQIAAEGVKIERLSRGDSGDVIEERDGGPATVFNPVQFFMPDNGRDRQEEDDG